MRFGLSLKPRVFLACRCTVCRQLIDVPAGSLREDETIQAMVGYTDWAKCPCCGHTVADNTDRNYHYRAASFIKQRENKQMKTRLDGHAFCRAMLLNARAEAAKAGVRIPKHITAISSDRKQFFVEAEHIAGDFKPVSGQYFKADCAFDAKAQFIFQLVEKRKADA